MKIRWIITVENKESVEYQYVKYDPIFNTEWYDREGIESDILAKIERYLELSPYKKLKLSIRKVYVS